MIIYKRFKVAKYHIRYCMDLFKIYSNRGWCKNTFNKGPQTLFCMESQKHIKPQNWSDDDVDEDNKQNKSDQ